MKQLFVFLILVYISFPVIFLCEEKPEKPEKRGTMITEKHSIYPKYVYVNSDNSDNAKGFEIWLGSDGHEYQLHIESHVDDQWDHYAGCIKCKK